MPKNYLIGIGGTGARVIEATIHLCAGGYGPDELNLFLIDPDAGNGNLTRTKNLISSYVKCRSSLQKPDSAQMFKTEIKIPADEKGLVWEIFSERGATLSNWINYENMIQNKPDLANLVSLLFTESELKTQLNEGFRGHPAIGSVVMSDIQSDKHPFKGLFEDIDRCSRENDVRIFFAGSVFGGTGAAGFPTLGAKQVLKYNKMAEIGEGVSKILLGGALVLPYFSFEPDKETEKMEHMFVTTNDFPIATKAALEYYNEKELGFDQIYLVGDSLNQKVGKFGVGSKKQENLPHYIELVSSLAAFDFFEQPQIKGKSEKKYFTAIRENEKVGWSDLPVSRHSGTINQKQTEIKSLLTYMTIFAWTFLTFGKRILSKGHSEIKDAWYKDHFKFKEKNEYEKIKDPRQKENKVEINDFESFLESFLFWLTSMDDNSGNIRFIDKSILLKDKGNAVSDLKLIDPEGEIEKSNIGLLLKNDPGNKGMDFNAYLRHLNSVDLNDKKVSKASMKFINIFYQAAISFSKANYNVN
jgi:hypothetical protein